MVCNVVVTDRVRNPRAYKALPMCGFLYSCGIENYLNSFLFVYIYLSLSKCVLKLSKEMLFVSRKLKDLTIL